MTRTQPTLRYHRPKQEALGYYTGPADGAIGPKTRNAVIVFQKVSGMPVTGEVSDELLDRLTAEIATAQ